MRISAHRQTQKRGWLGKVKEQVQLVIEDVWKTLFYANYTTQTFSQFT